MEENRGSSIMGKSLLQFHDSSSLSNTKEVMNNYVTQNKCFNVVAEHQEDTDIMTAKSRRVSSFSPEAQSKRLLSFSYDSHGETQSHFSCC